MAFQKKVQQVHLCLFTEEGENICPPNKIVQKTL